MHRLKCLFWYKVMECYYNIFFFILTDYKDNYKTILRDMVANHIGDHLDELADYLDVESGSFKSDYRRTENAAAALLKSWAVRKTAGKTPIWRDLLKAMEKSGMSKEASALQKFLTKGVHVCMCIYVCVCVFV